ncbi:MAG: histidine phosphatase family protein [Candidatus Diapherotrites archaeon]|nr:histidine phosphatase family protein [Candidatus Diapherotrites archaeon]
MRLLLVRNAQTQWNDEKRLHGNQDSPLTDEGKQQVQSLVDLLADESIDVVYSSDLGRAIDTVRPIVAKHAGLTIEHRRELRERSHGIAQGMTQRAVFEQYPKLQDERLKNKYTYKNPKGESYFDAETRLRPFVEELKQKHFSHTVLIVTHAGINRLLIGLLTAMSPQDLMAIDQPHDTVYEIENADTEPVVHHISPRGRVDGVLTREHTKKPSFADEEAQDVELDEEWA